MQQEFPTFLADSVLSVRMVESDTLYIGKPSGFYVSPSTGEFYIADSFASRIVRFGRDGRALSTIGQKGKGPGEFIFPRPLLISDTLMFVADNQQLRLQVLHAETGSYISSHLYSGVLYSAAEGSEEVWLAVNDRANRTGVTAFTPMPQITGRLVPWPEEYNESVRLAATFDAIYVEAWGDTILVGYQGSDDIIVISGEEIVETVTIPAIRRHGASTDVVSRLSDVPLPEAFSTISAVFGIHRLPGGQTAVVHFDQKWMEDYVTSEVFLSLLSVDRTRACVDHHVMSALDGQPKIAFRGDSLFVLSQKITGTDAETWVTAYRISGDSCSWTDLNDGKEVARVGAVGAERESVGPRSPGIESAGVARALNLDEGSEYHR